MRHPLACSIDDVLDVIYVLATLALFAVVGLIARAVERLGHRSGGSPRHGTTKGGHRG